ncbi:hypothetical protein POL68_25415 [Stigmatella sp. ncwal1]|uniref:Translocation and assembly module TamB n=1 Tax=Stigmatella ashevillensis TaxID=2995309 RepID=A0ABT5DFI0_9BACT|nr:hypothetical protein [Stigmatella ashevillena]MDC0711834.1 hypothetical protein [Stigmatella ashevillena]
MSRQLILDLLRLSASLGLPLSPHSKLAAHDMLLDLLDELLGLSDQLNDLGPGDSLGVSGKLGLGAGLDITLEPEVEVFRENDGTYRVSLGGDNGVGEGAGAAIHGLGGGKVEYRFSSREEARMGTLLVASANAVTSHPLLALALAPLPSELQFLTENLSSVEIRGGVNAVVDGKFLEGGLGLGAEAGLQLTTSYKLEFEQGTPNALARVTELAASGSVEASVVLFDKVGPRTSGAPLFTGISGGVKGTLSVESRIPLDSTEIPDLALFVLSPIIAPFSGPAVTTLKAALVVDAGPAGGRGEFEVRGLDGTELQRIVERLVDGDFSHALDDVNVETQGRWGSFVDTEYSLGFDNKTGGVGFEARIKQVHRDYTERGIYGG